MPTSISDVLSILLFLFLAAVWLALPVCGVWAIADGIKYCPLVYLTLATMFSGPLIYLSAVLDGNNLPFLFFPPIQWAAAIPIVLLRGWAENTSTKQS